MYSTTVILISNVIVHVHVIKGWRWWGGGYGGVGVVGVVGETLYNLHPNLMRYQDTAQ